VKKWSFIQYDEMNRGINRGVKIFKPMKKQVESVSLPLGASSVVEGDRITGITLEKKGRNQRRGGIHRT